MNRLFAIAVVMVAFSATGCRHGMEITNLHEYSPPPLSPLEPPRNIGITARNLSDPATRGYVDAIVDGLRHDGSFARVIYPYDASAHQNVTDVLVDVSVAPTYSGKGSNFFVNWPGFLIFAPAIWGYGYEATIDTRVSVSARNGHEQQLAIPSRFSFRQAEMDRTWTEIGWLELGIIPLIGGFVFTGYDTDLTPEFVTKVGPSYGAFVAQRIHEAVAGMPNSAVLPATRSVPPAEPAPAAPIPNEQSL